MATIKTMVMNQLAKEDEYARAAAARASAGSSSSSASQSSAKPKETKKEDDSLLAGRPKLTWTIGEAQDYLGMDVVNEENIKAKFEEVMPLGDPAAEAALKTLFMADHLTQRYEDDLLSLNQNMDNILRGGGFDNVDDAANYVFRNDDGSSRYRFLSDDEQPELVRPVEYDLAAMEEAFRIKYAEELDRKNAASDPAAASRLANLQKGAVIANEGSLLQSGAAPRNYLAKMSMYDQDSASILADGVLWAGTTKPKKAGVIASAAGAPPKPINEQVIDYYSEKISENQERYRENAETADPLVGKYADWTDDQKFAAQNYISDARGGHDTSEALIEMHAAGLSDEEIHAFQSEMSEALNSGDFTEEAMDSWFEPAPEPEPEPVEKPEPEQPAEMTVDDMGVVDNRSEEWRMGYHIVTMEQVHDAISNGDWETAAELQYGLLVDMVNNTDDRYVQDLVHSEGSQKAALSLMQMVQKSGLPNRLDDPDIRAQLRVYESYIDEALGLSEESGALHRLIDWAFNGAATQTQDNEGIGLWSTVKHAVSMGTAKFSDLFYNVTGSAISTYGAMVEGTNWLLNKAGVKTSNYYSDKIKRAGTDVAATLDPYIGRTDTYLREHATTAEYMGATFGGEAIKQGITGGVARAIGAAVTGAQAVDKIIGSGFERSLATAMDAVKLEQAVKMMTIAPFAAESWAAEFQQTMQETGGNTVTALLSGLITAGVTMATSDVGIVKNIQQKRLGVLPDVVETLSTVPGASTASAMTRGGKAMLLYMGNLLKSGFDEGFQEVVENVLGTAATDPLKGNSFIDRFKDSEYAAELTSDAIMGFMGSLTSSIGVAPEYSKSWQVANANARKSALTQADVEAQINAFVEDMNDPMVQQEMTKQAQAAAVSFRADELIASGAVNNSKVAAADEQRIANQERFEAARREEQRTKNAMRTAYERMKQDTSTPNTNAAVEAVRVHEAAAVSMREAEKELAKALQKYEAESAAVRAEAEEMARQEVGEQLLARQQERQQRDIAREQQRKNANADTLDVDDFISNDLTQAGWEPTEEERQKVSRLMQERRNARAASRAQSTEAHSDPDSNHRFVRAVEKKFGVKVTVTDTSKGGTVLRYNGAYDPRTDSIVIDSKATQSDLIYGTLLHELTHKAERSETYQEFASAILNLKYGGDDTRLAADIRAKQESYNRGLKAMAQLDESVDATELTADDASREIVADLTREILYGDEASINQLVAEQPSVARRVLDTIKNFIQKLTGVRDPAIDQLNRARELFEKALGESTQQMRPREKRSFPTDNIQYSLREEEPPKKTIKGYKVFAVFPNKPGELYPPMVANPGGADTPVGVWLNADAAPSAGETKTGRPQVQAGGKGTNTGKQKLAYRPGWHLGDSPRATQFNRLNPETGKKELFPENFVWAECDVAADLDYQEEAMSYGYNAKGNFQHSLAGLPRLPREEDGTAGFYRYRTNPNPDTVPWIISGAIKVNRILDDNETRAILNEQKQEFMASEEYAALSDADKEKALERFGYIERKGGDIDLAKFGLTAGDVNAENRVQYSLDDNTQGRLLSGAEYRRFQSNWNSQKHGNQFESRPNGGKIIAMDNLLVYTDENGEPEQVVEVNQDDLWLQNDIQQSLIQMEMDGVDVETQRIVLEGLVGTGSAYFRDRGSMQEPSGQERAGAGRNARAVRKGNYVEVSYEGEEVNGGRTQYSLPSDMVLVEMIDRYLARQEQGGGIAPPNMAVGQAGQQEQPRMGKRQFANQTLQDSPAMPDWLKQELRTNPADSDYEIDSNYAQAERGWNRIQENGYEQERDRLLQLERFSADDTAEANLIMAMAEREGDAETLLAVASKYNREGTKVGHELQARKLFTRMSPTAAKVMVAGQLESRLQDELRDRRPLQRRMDEHAHRVADRLTALPEPEEASSENRWHVPLNQQQLELIREYGLQRTRRPGIYYNRATTEQRMLEAIIATPNPLAATGNGLNLVQRLEYMNSGLAVVTNADLNYIGTQLGQFIGLGGEVGSRDADVAVARAYEAFGNITPVGRRQKMRTWRYMSMLGTLTSPARNIIGNVAQSVPNAVSHGLAANVVDPIVSLFTGQRTTASLDVRERVEGWRAFVQETEDTFNDFFVDRVEVQNRLDDKFNTNRSGRVYQSPVLEAARNLEGFLMSVGDRNFWKKAYVNSIAEQQKLLDRGLLRNEDGTTPTQEQILERAEADANYATFNEDNRVRDAVTALKQVPGLGDAIDFIMPFTGVPTNIISRMWQYSPMGLASTVLTHAYRGMSGQNFDQRSFVDGISRGITGTALFGVGMILQAAGIIRLGTGDEEDDKKRGVRTAQGEQYTPYIYNPFNGEYVGLAAFAPAISPLIMGATAQDILKDEEDKWVAVQNAAFAGLDQIFDASYMTGLADVFGGYGSPSENIGTSLFSSAVSQNVPALLGQISSAMDPYVRDTKDKNLIMEALKSGLISKIPGLRESLPKKIDVTGQPVMQGKEGIENFFNPFTVTDARNDAVLNEMMRVGALPSDALSGRRNDLTSNGVDFTVDAKGKETYKQRYGDLWYNGGTYVDGNGNRLEVPGVADLIESSAYAKMTDTEKSKAINKTLELAARVAKAEAAVAAGEDPAKVWGKAEESQRSVLKSNAQIQVEAGHYSALTTYVSDLRKTGVANKYIKSQVTTLMKPIYKELNRKGETEKMKEIRRILYQTGMYDDFNFEKEWLK